MKKYSYTHYQSPEVYEREQSQGLRKIFEFDKTLKELEIKMSEKEINELWIELVRDMNEYFVGDENNVLTIRCEKKLNEKITQLNSLLTISRFVVKKLGLPGKLEPTFVGFGTISSSGLSDTPAPNLRTVSSFSFI